MRSKITIENDISFKKVNNVNYLVELDEEKLNIFVEDIMNSFTIGKISVFSLVMDIAIGEELISRVLADAFVNKHKDIVLEQPNGIILSYTLSDVTYKITIANNSEKLGGIVYGILV